MQRGEYGAPGKTKFFGGKNLFGRAGMGSLRTVKGEIGEHWWSRGDSNPLPFDCQSNVLPSELRPHKDSI
jgi:hypothetical protein